MSLNARNIDKYKSYKRETSLKVFWKNGVNIVWHKKIEIRG